MYLEKFSDPAYRETIRFLFDLQLTGIKMGLEKITAFLDKLGNPHRGKKTIHVAGTNGKGSVIAIMEALLMEAGYDVGAYTSPHLVTFQERIRINQQLIPAEKVIEFVNEYRQEIASMQLTFFEATTALAFWYFHQTAPDILLIETGLGGRLDSTNVIHSPIVAITHIDYDHMEFLGNTIDAIAREKAGIIHPGSRVYCSRNSDTVIDVIRQRCAHTGSSLTLASDMFPVQPELYTADGMKFAFTYRHHHWKELISPLIGSHQLQNLQLALGLLLEEELIPPDEALIRRGLQKILWPGRLQKIQDFPPVFLDAGHNPDGFRAAFQSLREAGYHQFLVLTGIVSDKDARIIVQILEEHASRIVLVPFSSKRFLPSERFFSYFTQPEKVEISRHPVYETFLHWQGRMHTNDTMVIIGSHYLLGEFFEEFLKRKKSIDSFFRIP